MMKTTWWPQPHYDYVAMSFELDDATIDSTIVPLLRYDEGLGSPSAQETHPENAAFATRNSDGCFVNSRVNRMFTELQLSLTSHFRDDNLMGVKIAFSVIKLAFKEDYIAIDELTSVEVQDVLEMQTESTDRQGFPLWANADMAEPSTNHGNLAADVPGLTTDASIEGVAFDEALFYDAIHYYTISNKLKNAQRGLKWITLNDNRPYARIRINIDSKVKRMNEYTFFGLLLHCPIAGDGNGTQIVFADEITAATKYVTATVRSRFNEWNEDFNFKKIQIWHIEEDSEKVDKVDSVDVDSVEIEKDLEVDLVDIEEGKGVERCS